ncbi:MAG TPA: 16S rRNA (adenine(1518)-N(6)/adenine(1519)-N(6))-dimethyltransferase RsmA [Acidimicrobiia bacterium]|jgi:16S rRNA (adenine1518-N6/adenine1519-N6)-dimethyltransferase|nr:16S rRNA (adenine(1518)-N(6)/adenine(1519)-N(6))-dimethyltransferase RsmA [Acidimicrobiia bacterium]
MALLTPAKVRSLLDAHGLHPKRSLGQNFLADANTARRVVALADLPTAASVLEIGPGLGSLTLALLDAGHDVVALELDDRLADVLHAVLADESGASGAGARVRIERGDAVTVDLAAILTPAPSPRACVSNLPYNVAVPVVVRLLEEADAVERILVMVQREVGERLAAGPGDPQYGAVSVKVAYFAEAHVVGLVPPTVFVPRPKVESALVRLRRRGEPPVTVPSADGLFALVRAGFAQRRKMLRRSLAPVLGDAAPDVLEAAGVAPTARAEALGLDDWAAVARSAAAAA